MMAAEHLHPVSRVLDALSNAGCNPKQSSPGQWNAKCPVTAAHKAGDKNPSLSLAEGLEGKALLTCHRGCTLPDIAQALNLGLRDLFPKRDKVADFDQKRIVATYPYVDADGELIYEVVRYRPKDFRQRQRDTQGGWVWSIANIADEQRPLYHLPQVLRAVETGRTIWIVEGEKDAENLQWHVPQGDVVTTNSGGAKYWRPHHAKTLQGANVIVVPDNDNAGKERAVNIVTSLIGIARTVRVIAVPEPHKDASDALRVGIEPPRWRNVPDDEFITWAAVTDTPTDTDSPDPIIVNWPDFWATDHVTEDWLIEPLLPAGRAISVYAPAKTGKSLVILSAVAAACTGRSVWGLPAQPPVRILYLDYEMTPNDLRERLELLGYGPEIDLSNLRYALIPSLPPFDTPEGGQALLELAQAENVRGIIIDTFGRATQGDENDADTTRAYYRNTGGLLKKHGIASLRTDHAGKDLERGQRGSSAKNDDVDLVHKLTRTDDGVRLTRTHSRMSWIPELIELVRHEDDYGVWDFRRAAGTGGWPARTKEAAERLDELGLPVNIATRKAAEALKAAGDGFRRQVVNAAVKYRKQGLRPVDNPEKWFPEPLSQTASEPAAGTTTRNSLPPAAEPVGNHPEPVGQAPWEPGSPPKGGTGPSPTPDLSLLDDLI